MRGRRAASRLAEGGWKPGSPDPRRWKANFWAENGGMSFGSLGRGVTIRNGLPGRLSGPPDLVCLAGRPGRSGLSGRLGLGVTIRKALPGRPARQIWSVRPTRSGLFGWPARQIPGPVIRRPRGDIAKWTAYFGLGASIRPSLVFMPVIDGSHGR
jgi:hypothetical protein